MGLHLEWIVVRPPGAHRNSEHVHDPTCNRRRVERDMSRSSSCRGNYEGMVADPRILITGNTRERERRIFRFSFGETGREAAPRPSGARDVGLQDLTPGSVIPRPARLVLQRVVQVVRLLPQPGSASCREASAVSLLPRRTASRRRRCSSSPISHRRRARARRSSSTAVVSRSQPHRGHAGVPRRAANPQCRHAVVPRPGAFPGNSTRAPMTNDTKAKSSHTSPFMAAHLARRRCLELWRLTRHESNEYICVYL